MIVLILAGGGGTRLWPLSTQKNPKQFLAFGNQPSLLQKTVLRFLHLDDVQKILIATNNQYEELVRENLKQIQADQRCRILVEPDRRNTAPAIAYALSYLQEEWDCQPSDPVIVLPSDHLIDPESVFLESIKNAIGLTRDRIVTFGVQPTKPETGYGYIEIGEPIDSSSYKIHQFVEKPNLAKAEYFIASNRFYWNSGMFLFSIETFWSEMKLHAPQIYNLIGRGFDFSKNNYSSFPDISIDYAMMEKSSRLAVAVLPLNWSDIGSWDSVYEMLDKDPHRNVKMGNVQEIETDNCLILSHKRPIAAIGLHDLIIVETEEAVFICKRGESQKVKLLLQKMSS
ncbi:MAG: mannose-1-phosphate guanylyltransferase [Verrucomicrobia bacterium]|nr:mannose-1-phosphate guanylyltransferase [Verrucomicrobiota bacterium]